MLASVLLLALAGHALAVKNQVHKNVKARFADAEIDAPPVPTYNISMPVDHFDTSNHDTFNNRYFVNDTYYSPGGPVILFDFGESGFSPISAAEFLAEWNGTTSACMRLAEELGGLVIGWEHRYYGYSQPYPIDNTGDGENTWTQGVPAGGAQDYQYHTIEQAIEDLAYFANNFNSTQLGQNTVVTSSANLDPYHTPWIIMGGSYPGMRSAWARERHPEVFYAAWASSAPVQTQYDGSIYYNQIYRAMPSNCTSDIQAVVGLVDSILASGNETSIAQVKAAVYLAANSSAEDVSGSAALTPRTIGEYLANAFTQQGSYQSYGPQKTSQYFCDWMESFDTEAYLSAYQAAGSNLFDQSSAMIQNPGGAKAPKDGIAAANGDSGPALAFAAYQFATTWSAVSFYNWSSTLDQAYEPFTESVDTHSWNWQTLIQLGFFQGSNETMKMNLLIEMDNTTAEHDNTASWFPADEGFPESSIPTTPNFTGPLLYDGWNMKPSNVMFTNGQFDPWRAFSVASLETESGAPGRDVTQNVPKCNQPPSGTDVFGIVYDGAVHVEDIATYPYTRGNEDVQSPPLQQGLKLFVQAWNEWVQCFNQSRDDVRNGRGVDGSGNGVMNATDAGPSNSSSSSSGDSGSGNSAAKPGSSLLSVVLIGLAVLAFEVST